jgi:hypothetical protein
MMNGPLRSAHDHPLSQEGAKLHLVLEETDRVVIAIQTLHNTIRGGIDRTEAILAEQQALLHEARKNKTETAEQYTAVLQAVRCVMHTMVEKELPESIAQAVALNVYLELTPQLKEESEKNAAASAGVARELMTAVSDLKIDVSTTIADAIAGKPPLPPVPPDDAPLTAKAKGHAIRGFAKAHRFLVSSTHTVVWFTCLVVLYATAAAYSQRFL